MSSIENSPSPDVIPKHTPEQGQSSRSIPRRCRVPACPNKRCTLITHRMYKPRKHKTVTEQPRSDAALAAFNELALVEIDRGGVDGLPTLPIEDRLDPQLRGLFHHFFDSAFERTAETFRGPSVTSMAEYKRRMLSAALGCEAYCMGLIIQAQTSINVARHAVVEQRSSLEVYTKSVAAFRKHIARVQERPHPLQIELALLTLCTLIAYDLFHSRDMAVKMHRQGLIQLVTMRGGIHQVTLALAYVIHVDRLCAFVLKSPPTWLSSPQSILPIPRPSWSKYGAKFLMLTALTDSPFSATLLDHCVDTSGLLELWEGCKDPTAASAQNTFLNSYTSLEYLYYTRDRVDERFAVMHAQTSEAGALAKCLLWASRIVEYQITWTNYVPTLTSILCEEVTKTLQTQHDLVGVWAEYLDMLRWILFALATAERSFEDRDWVVTMLRKMIVSRLGSGPWPDNWWKQELENLEKFAWCNSHYMTQFHDVCCELDTVNQIEGTHSTFQAASSSRHHIDSYALLLRPGRSRKAESVKSFSSATTTTTTSTKTT